MQFVKKPESWEICLPTDNESEQKDKIIQEQLKHRNVNVLEWIMYYTIRGWTNKRSFPYDPRAN